MKLSFRLLLYVLAALLIVTLVASGCGRKGKVVVTVNKEGIERALFEKRLERAYGSSVLNALVQEVLTIQYAEKNKLLPTEAEIKTELEERKKTIKEETKKEWEQYLKDRDQTEEEFREEIKAFLASFNIATKGVKVTDEEVKEFYDNMVAALQAPFYQFEQMHVYHIESKDKTVIDKAYDMLKKGATWATVTLQMSEATDKNNAGDMGLALVSKEGWIGFPNPRRGQPPLRPFDEDTEKLILKIPQDRYSEPMKVSLFGGQIEPSWQIYRVTEKREQKTLKFAESKTQARRLLMQSRARSNETTQKEIESYQKFTREAKIKAFEEKYIEVGR